MKGRAAFAVYSEEKEEPQFNELKSSANNRRIILNDRNKNKKSILAPIVPPQTKARDDKLKMKKEKAKFSKLTTDNLRECITLFNGSKPNNGNSDHHGPKSAEFRQMSVSTSKKTNNNRNNKRRINESPQLTAKKSAKIDVKKHAAGVDVDAIEKKKIVKEVKMSKKFKSAEVDDEESQEFMFDSRKEAIKLFNKIINPIKHKDFFNNYWEKQPLLVKRGVEDYYKEWFSCKEFDKILRNHNLEFTTNIDITTYINDVKQKHNPEGRAFAPRVWDFFQQGCSIRLLNPSTYSKNIWKYLSLLQDFFGSCVGANIYLTPKGTQGFAPHYDDIEAFVLQLEGRKHWRVYAPLDDPNTLPRYSSENFSQGILPEPLLDVVLEPGDLLYFPRGFVHQANAIDDIHSLHITVSCYQLNSWGDFLSKLIPGAVETAMGEDVEFRRGLPIGYLDHNGIAFSDNKPTKERTEFRKKTLELFKKLIKHLPIDAAVDQMGKRFIQESLPPSFTKFEKNLSIHGQGETWNEKKNRVENISEIAPDTTIKLIRKNCLRLVMENDSILVYHNLENSKIFCEKESVPLEIEVEAAPAIEALIHAYPKYIRVDNLPIETPEDRITVAQCLYDKGLLVTGEPLECEHEDNSDDEEDDNDECEYDDENGIDDDDDEEEDIDDDFNSVDYDNFGDDDEINEDVDEEEGENEENGEDDEEDNTVEEDDEDDDEN